SKRQPLYERARAEKAARHLIASTHLGRHRRASGDSSATSDDSVRSKVAGILIRDVHRPAFAATIARGFPEQLGKHLVYGCALGEAMAVAAVRTRNVVIPPQRLAHAHANRFLSNIEMCETRHLGRQIKLVHLLFEQADLQHLAIKVKRLIAAKR